MNLKDLRKIHDEKREANNRAKVESQCVEARDGSLVRGKVDRKKCWKCRRWMLDDGRRCSYCGAESIPAMDTEEDTLP